MRDPQNDQLLSRLQSGDERALAELADAYGTKIYQLAFRYLRNKEDAEEVTQDVLFKVYRKVGAFRGDAALSSWIYRITFNAAMSRVRTAQLSAVAGRRSPDARRTTTSRRPRRSGTSPTGATWQTSGSCARSCAVGCCARFWRCPAIYRAPVMLRDIQGMSTEEASAMLRVKDQTLEVASPPRTADSPQATRRFRRRAHDAPANLRHVD